MKCPVCEYEIEEGGMFVLSVPKEKSKESVVPREVEIRATRKFVCGGCDSEIRVHESYMYQQSRKL
jgi:hypothetical protein